MPPALSTTRPSKRYRPPATILSHSVSQRITDGPNQLIKKLSATPIIPALNELRHPVGPADSQAALQANKATFFFQLVGMSDYVGATRC